MDLAHDSGETSAIRPKPWRRRMPTRTQQIGLLMLLAVLMILAVVRALTL